MLKKMMLTALLLIGTGSQAMAAELTVHDAWMRLPPPVASNTAAYMRLTNPGDAAVRITGLDTPIARKADIHGMRMHEGRMQMYPLGEVSIPAGGSITLQPGGKHLMLIGLARALRKGEIIRITLHYGDGSQQTLTVPVRDVRMGGMMQEQHDGGRQ